MATRFWHDLAIEVSEPGEAYHQFPPFMVRFQFHVHIVWVHAAAASGKGIFHFFYRCTVQFSLNSLAFLLPKLSPLLGNRCLLFNLGLCNRFLILGLCFSLLVHLCLKVSNPCNVVVSPQASFQSFQHEENLLRRFFAMLYGRRGKPHFGQAFFDRRSLLRTPGLKLVERPEPSASLLDLLFLSQPPQCASARSFSVRSLSSASSCFSPSASDADTWAS